MGLWYCMSSAWVYDIWRIPVGIPLMFIGFIYKLVLKSSCHIPGMELWSKEFKCYLYIKPAIDIWRIPGCGYTFYVHRLHKLVLKCHIPPVDLGLYVCISRYNPDPGGILLVKLENFLVIRLPGSMARKLICVRLPWRVNERPRLNRYFLLLLVYLLSFLS